MNTRLFIPLILILSGLIINNASAAAVTYTWTGHSGDGKWTTTGNWSSSTNKYPGNAASDIAAFTTSGVSVSIPASANIKIGEITLKNGDIVTITNNSGNPMDISGTTVFTSASGSATTGITLLSTSSASTFSFTGTFTIGQKCTLTTSGYVSFNSGSTINFGSTGSSLNNTGTLTTSGATFSYAGGSGWSFTNNGTFKATSTTFDFNQSNAGMTNQSGSFTATGCTFKLASSATSFTNASGADFTAQSGCTFTLSASSTCTIENDGTYVDHGSTYTLGQFVSNIDNTGTFSLDDNATINITGQDANIYNSGTFTAGISNSACTINASGTGLKVASIVPASSKYTSIYNDNGGVFTLGSTSTINLTGTTATTPTVCYNNTGGTFTLMSDANGSATIGQISAGGSMQGIYNVQRYIAATRGYRSLSAPVNQNSYTAAPGNTDLTDLWQSETVPSPFYGAYVAGPSGGGFPNTNAGGNPIIYLYQESLQPGANYNTTFLSGNNVGVSGISGAGSSFSFTTKNTVTSGSNTNQDNVSGVTLPAGNGFLLYYIGNSQTSTQRGGAVTTSNITHTGYINQGDIAFSYWGKTPSNVLTSTPGSRYQGLTLLGNPYPSTIDLYQFYIDNYNISVGGFFDAYFNTPFSGVFYQLNGLNNSSFPSFSTSIFGSSGSGASEYVASGEGFYAVIDQTTITDLYTSSSYGNCTITFSEDQKTNTSASGSGALYLAATKPLAAAAPARPQYANLHLKLAGGNTTDIDECGIYLNKAWSDKFDRLDARDLDGTAPSIYLSSITSDNVRTAINAMGDYTAGKRIKLYVRGTTDGIYNLSLEDIANIDTTNFRVYLVDAKLNDSLDMVHYKKYNFNLETADTASFSGRFLLAFDPKPVPPYQLITFSGQKASNNAIKLDWKTVNEGDNTSFGLEKLGTNGLYTLIDSVQSNGSGTYSFNDPNVIMGNNIYRLAQADIHGKIVFAGPININYNTTSAGGMFNIYPNPSKDIINIAVNSGTTGSQATPTYLASIYNLSGTAMDSRQVKTNNWTQDITSYKAGVYILELKSADGNIIGKAKFVKTN